MKNVILLSIIFCNINVSLSKELSNCDTVKNCKDTLRCYHVADSYVRTKIYSKDLRAPTKIVLKENFCKIYYPEKSDKDYCDFAQRIIKVSKKTKRFHVVEDKYDRTNCGFDDGSWY